MMRSDHPASTGFPPARRPSWSDIGCGLVGCAAFVVGLLLAVTLFAGTWAMGEWLGWQIAEWLEAARP